MTTIIYDGYCNLCSFAVQFIAKRDKANQFYFVASASEEGERLLRLYGYDPQEITTIVVIENSEAYERSEAIFRIVKHIPRWKWLSIFQIFPRTFLDKIYDFIAKIRYKVFGKRESCLLPPNRSKMDPTELPKLNHKEK